MTLAARFPYNRPPHELAPTPRQVPAYHGIGRGALGRIPATDAAPASPTPPGVPDARGPAGRAGTYQGVERDVKQILLGTRLGKAAMTLRSSLHAVKAACFQPEVAGMVANDQMAEYLGTRLCRASRTMVDVGAHIGSFFHEVSEHQPSARIIAVEAIPKKVELLRRKFPAVEIHSCALGEAEGTATFYVNTVASGFSSLGRPSDEMRSQVVEIEVPVRRLDDLVSSREVDLIKIDVEGAELGVLRGAGRLFGESRPTVLFESGPTGDDGLNYPKEDLWGWFAERDYAVLVPNRLAHLDDGLSRDGFVESHLYPRRTTNYFAVPRERRLEVRAQARRILGLDAG